MLQLLTADSRVGINRIAELKSFQKVRDIVATKTVSSQPMKVFPNDLLINDRVCIVLAFSNGYS